MTEEINNIAVNLMIHNNQHAEEPLQTRVGERIRSGESDAVKEQDLSLKNHSYGEMPGYREQQALLSIKKHETEHNTDKHSGIQTVPSINNFSAFSHPDNQYFIPMHHLTPDRMGSQPSSYSQPPNEHLASLDLCGDEASRKRELRLLKNKEAAKECRRKKKEYVRCLEDRVNLLENQNKTLIEELKSLKELYCQKDVQS